MKSNLKNEVKAIVAKWKGLIDYLKEEDRKRPLRVSRIQAKA